MKNYSLKIPSTGQICKVESKLKLNPGQEVLVELESIIEPAIILCDKKNLNANSESKEIRVKILRTITPEDLQFKEELAKKARKYLDESKAKVFRHGLEMKILEAELSFDEKKLTFYFSAEGRIDFRALVADMVGSFHKIIRLQQVGARDEAKLFGGFGKCGRELCCAKFLNNLESITLEMAEVQEIANTKPSKITGCCGKLMCCLSYEADLYNEIKSKMPKIGTEIKTFQGEGKVVGHNIFEGKVIIETKEGKKFEVIV